MRMGVCLCVRVGVRMRMRMHMCDSARVRKDTEQPGTGLHMRAHINTLTLTLSHTNAPHAYPCRGRSAFVYAYVRANVHPRNRIGSSLAPHRERVNMNRPD